MKTFSLFKRGAAGKVMSPEADGYRDRPFHYKFTFKGKVYPRCLQTNDAALAQSRARLLYKEITEAIIAGQFERLDGTKTRHTVHASLAKLLAIYRQAPVDATPDTREKNINSLFNLLTQTFDATKEQLLETPFPKTLNGDTAEAWFKLKLKHQRNAGAEVTDTSMNSTWRKVASICSAKGAKYSYKKAGIWHDCLQEFTDTGVVCQKQVSKAAPRPPNDTIIQRTMAAWEVMEDRNLFLAIGHELAFGLRVGEVAQVRHTWWQDKYGTPMLCATGNFKHNLEGYFEVPGLDPFYSILRNKALARGWLNPTLGEYIITGSDTFRTDGLAREVSEFLREQGWETKKTNHALRAYAGGLVALKFGVFAAKNFLRHSSVKVTQDHYLYLMNNPMVDTIRDACPAKWATLEKVPTLTVLEGSA